MKIAVVGGGTAGFVSALILKTSFPNFEIDVIRSTKIGTIGVWATKLTQVAVPNVSYIVLLLCCVCHEVVCS